MALAGGRSRNRVADTHNPGKQTGRVSHDTKKGRPLPDAPLVCNAEPTYWRSTPSIAYSPGPMSATMKAVLFSPLLAIRCVGFAAA